MKFQFENPRPEISDDDLLNDLRRVAAAVQGGVITMNEYRRTGKHATITFQKRFGSWRNAVKAAGFETGYKTDTLPDEVLLDNLRDCWMKLGRQPRQSDMQEPASKYTHHPYIRRYGTWLNALKTFCDLVETADVELIAATDPATTGRGSRDPSLRMRFLVMRRDQFRCLQCGRSPATSHNVILHVDHILAWSKGGATVAENLRTLCSKCNLGKSDLHSTQAE